MNHQHSNRIPGMLRVGMVVGAGMGAGVGAGASAGAGAGASAGISRLRNALESLARASPIFAPNLTCETVR